MTSVHEPFGDTALAPPADAASVAPDRPARDGLQAKVLGGLGWKAVSLVALQGSRLIVAVILARLLSPTDFGLAGMVLVFTSLVFIFADLGLGSALVQRQGLTQTDRSTVFWTATGVGATLTLLGIACAGLIADFYREPAVRALFIGLAVNFFIVSLGTTHNALLNKDMRFKRLELLKIGAALSGAVIGVTMAATGYGAWAIVAQLIAIESASTILLWCLCSWRPSFRYSLTSLRNLGGFGANVLGTQLLFFVNRQSDNLLIGRFLGPSSLGAYALSYNVMLAPFNQIAGPVQEVLFPAFSQIQDDPRRIASVWVRVNHVVGALAIPALAGLAVLAPDFVPVVLGDKWHEAIRVIQILTWVGALQCLQRLNSSILAARDQTGTLIRFAMVATAATLIAFFLGLHWGIVGIAAGYAISSTFVESYYTWLTARTLGTSPMRLVRALGGVIQSTAVMVAVLLVGRRFLVRAEVGQAERLLILIVVGAGVYAGMMALLDRGLITELKDLRQSRGGGGTAGTHVPESRPIRPPWWAPMVRGRRGDLLAIGGLLSLCAGLLAVTWHTWGDLGRDTGYESVAASRVAGGELPYVDYTYYYGPLAPLMTGLAVRLGGSGLTPILIFGVIVAVAIVLATYVLARQLAGRGAGFLAGAIVAPVAFATDNFSFVLPHTHSATLGVLATLGALICLGRASGGSRRWALLAGVATGLGALTRPEVAVALALGCIAWIALRWRAGAGGWREALCVAGPAIAIPAVVYGLFLTRVSAHALLFENLYPVDVLKAAGNAVLRIQAPLTAGSFVTLAGRLLLYGVAAALLTWAAHRLTRGRARWRVAQAVIAAAALIAVAALAVRPRGAATRAALRMGVGPRRHRRRDRSGRLARTARQAGMGRVGCHAPCGMRHAHDARGEALRRLLPAELPEPLDRRVRDPARRSAARPAAHARVGSPPRGGGRRRRLAALPGDRRDRPRRPRRPQRAGDGARSGRLAHRQRRGRARVPGGARLDRP